MASFAFEPVGSSERPAAQGATGRPPRTPVAQPEDETGTDYEVRGGGGDDPQRAGYQVVHEEEHDSVDRPVDDEGRCGHAVEAQQPLDDVANRRLLRCAVIPGDEVAEGEVELGRYLECGDIGQQLRHAGKLNNKVQEEQLQQAGHRAHRQEPDDSWGAMDMAGEGAPPPKSLL